jgi:hypothetical protein
MVANPKRWPGSGGGDPGGRWDKENKTIIFIFLFLFILYMSALFFRIWRTFGWW